MKVRGGSGIIENNRNKRGVGKSRKRRHVEYLAISRKVATTFIIIFEMCRKEAI
jgi:hypothetical protein